MASAGSDAGFLQLATTQAISCNLHPVVMFQILDHHTRRNVEEGRVVGALLGSVGSDGSVSLKNAFSMSHDDVTHGAQAYEFNQFFDTMVDLHRRVNSREQVVGWYTTSKSSDAGKDDVIGDDDVALHSFFERKIGEKHPCILLRVDSNIQQATKLGISAFVASNMSLGNKDSPVQLGKCFAKVPCTLRTYEVERIGVDFITQNSIGEGGGEVLGSDLEKLEASMTKLTAMLDKTIEYLDDVEGGKIAPDSTVGRKLMEAVSSVPDLSVAEFDAALSNGLQDSLMIHYLGSLTQSQVCFWQRVQTMV
jgi:translation initiation factor 3 subunit F